MENQDEDSVLVFSHFMYFSPIYYHMAIKKIKFRYF